MSEYYSSRYISSDFKVFELKLDWDGNTLEKTQFANYANLASVIDDPDMARLFPEKLAKELADKMNTVYLKGWEDSSATAEQAWGSSV